MSTYQKPTAVIIDETTEGIFMDNSGEKSKCNNGRTEANAGSDTCQKCSYKYTHNIVDPNMSFTRKDYSTCPENMPEKK